MSAQRQSRAGTARMSATTGGGRSAAASKAAGSPAPKRGGAASKAAAGRASSGKASQAGSSSGRASSGKASRGRAGASAKAPATKAAASKPRASKAAAAKPAASKTTGAKASASKPASKASSKTTASAARQTARSKTSGGAKGASAAKKAQPAKAAPERTRPSDGFVRRGVRAFTRSYPVRFATVLFVIVAAAFVAASAFSAQSNAPVTQRADGLPVYITDEMIDTARAMQHEYGHPAGCTIAQIIQESGQGTALSVLAERDNNLFGMKWVDAFAGKHGVVGPVQWGTNEEYDGKTVAIKDSFIRFESKKACIEFRSSVFLQSSTYADNPTIRRAIETRNSALMAWGLQDAGWATDSAYAEHLVAVMDRYDLYRFDS